MTEQEALLLARDEGFKSLACGYIWFDSYGLIVIAIHDSTNYNINSSSE